MISVSTTKARKVNYIEEHEPGSAEPIKFSGPVTAEVATRDWDVTDWVYRNAAAEEQLGAGANDDDYYSQHAMWFINKDANAAVLIVFRPKPANVAA